MDFKSQICTTREQSERLLSLGLKLETADMCYNLYFSSWSSLCATSRKSISVHAASRHCAIAKLSKSVLTMKLAVSNRY